MGSIERLDDGKGYDVCCIQSRWIPLVANGCGQEGSFVPLLWLYSKQQISDCKNAALQKMHAGVLQYYDTFISFVTGRIIGKERITSIPKHSIAVTSIWKSLNARNIWTDLTVGFSFLHLRNAFYVVWMLVSLICMASWNRDKSGHIGWCMQ